MFRRPALPSNPGSGPTPPAASAARARRLARAARAGLAPLEKLESRVLFSSYALGVVAGFGGNNGSSPEGGLVSDARGNLYGTTDGGGTGGDGTVFEIPVGGKTVVTLASFNGTDGSGAFNGLIVDAGGNLFGTTSSGGANGAGTVFEVAAGSNTITTLADFAGGPGGSYPKGRLVMDSAGDLFGTTFLGGDSNDSDFGIGDGTVFEVPAGTNTVLTLAQFSGGAGGSNPEGSLVMDSAGNLFGTTFGGGDSGGDGTVFEVPADAPGASAGPVAPDTLVTFTGADGSGPASGLVADAAGNLFGTTEFGGPAGDGTVFELPTGTYASPTTPATLASFAGTDGQYPVGDLTLDGGGDVFGTAFGGGASSAGTAFEVVAGSGAITPLASFDTAHGTAPLGGLTPDGSGDFFGAASAGGDQDSGAVFELTPVAASVPTATISAPPVNAATGAETVTVTYTSSVGIDPATLDKTNLTVTGPAGSPLTVTGFTTSGLANSLTAFYNVAAPVNPFTSADNGTYTVTLNGRGGKPVADTAGTPVARGTGTFQVNLGVGPSVKLIATNITTAGGTEKISATYTDPAGVALSSIDANNLVVTTPTGSHLAAMIANVTPPQGQPTTVTLDYVFAAPFTADAPNGGWSTADNGTYTVELPAGRILDTPHQNPNADFKTSFTVNVPTAPPRATFSSPPAVTTPSASEFVTVTYTAGAGIDLSSITVNNLSVASPFGTAVPVSAVSLTPTTGTPPSVTATYTINAPGGAWSAAANGAYTVSLNTGQVKDTLGQGATAQPTAFVVNLPPANADNTFAGGAGVNLPFSAQAATTLSSGQVLVAGFQGGATAGSTQAVLERLNGLGAVDTTFGSGGMAIDSSTADEKYFGLAVLPSGQTLVSGTSNGSLLLAEFNADGSPVASFGAGGRVVTAVGGATDATACGVAVDPRDNGIVVAGGAGGQFVVARFLASGAPDPAFHGGAPLAFDGGTAGSDVLGKVVVQGDGAIVGAGASGASAVVTRVTAAGAPDGAFGRSGVAALSQLATLSLANGQLDHSEGVALDPTTGRIVVANVTLTGKFGVVRLNTDGSLDTTFGTAGLATTDFGGRDDADVVAIQPDGSQILVAGTATSNGSTLTAVAAYKPDGSPDTTFAPGGKESFQSGLPAVAGAAGAATASAARPSRPGGIVRDAEGIGAIIEQIFGTLQPNGQLLLGNSVSGTGSGSGASKVRRLNVTNGSTTSTSLPVGTLKAAVAGSLPPAVVGGARAKASVSVTVTAPAGKAVNGPVTITLYVSQVQSLAGATRVATLTRSLKLKAGRGKTFRIKIPSFPAVADGDYVLLAGVQAPDNTVSGAAGPSLRIAAPFVKVQASGLTPLTASIAPGGRGTLALTLHNAGNQPVNATGSLAVSGQAAGAAVQALATVPLKVSLKAGTTRTFRVRFAVPAGLAAGRYTLSVALTGLGDRSAADGSAIAAGPLQIS